jgi:hypothetical protein
MKIDLQRIEITNLKEGTFFAKLILQQEEKKMVIDARPSDAMGIAVRKKCPIFIAEAVVEDAGIPISSITEQNISSEDVDPSEQEREKLKKDLETAVAEENYEEAARIRDRLNELDDTNTS